MEWELAPCFMLHAPCSMIQAGFNWYVFFVWLVFDSFCPCNVIWAEMQFTQIMFLSQSCILPRDVSFPNNAFLWWFWCFKQRETSTMIASFWVSIPSDTSRSPATIRHTTTRFFSFISSVGYLRNLFYLFCSCFMKNKVKKYHKNRRKTKARHKPHWNSNTLSHQSHLVVADDFCDI